jgi:hypothetical protein
MQFPPNPPLRLPVEQKPVRSIAGAADVTVFAPRAVEALPLGSADLPFWAVGIIFQQCDR